MTSESIEKTLEHGRRLRALIQEGKLAEAICVHNRKVSEDMERAQQGQTIDLTALMIGRETLDQAREGRP